MKIRTNFVSNSSSSSFICLVDKTAFDNAFENWEPDEAFFNIWEDYHELKIEDDFKEIFEELKNTYLKNSNVFGKDVYEYSYLNVMDTYWDEQDNLKFDLLFDSITKDISEKDKFESSLD